MNLSSRCYNIKRNLQATGDSQKQAIMSTNGEDVQNTIDRQSEEIQSLKRELDEVRKNAEENKQMIQQLKDKLEKTEQSLRDQLKVNTESILQVKTIFNSPWLFWLYCNANSGNEVVPVVIKLAEFQKYEKGQSIDLTGFYTGKDKGYKMCLRVYPKGKSQYSPNNDVDMDVYLMEGRHDFDPHLTWPIKGILTVQVLNQFSDSNHSKPVKFRFTSYNEVCRMLVRSRVASIDTGRKSDAGVGCKKILSHNDPSDDAAEYLKDDCVFFRVCSFQPE